MYETIIGCITLANGWFGDTGLGVGVCFYCCSWHSFCIRLVYGVYTQTIYGNIRPPACPPILLLGRCGHRTAFKRSAEKTPPQGGKQYETQSTTQYVPKCLVIIFSHRVEFASQYVVYIWLRYAVYETTRGCITLANGWFGSIGLGFGVCFYGSLHSSCTRLVCRV